MMWRWVVASWFTPRWSHSAPSLCLSTCFHPSDNIFADCGSSAFMPSLLFSSPSFPPVPFLVLLPPVCAPLNRVNDREREKGKPWAGLHHPLTYPRECLTIMQMFANERNRLCEAAFAVTCHMRPGLWLRKKEEDGARSSPILSFILPSNLCARAPDCPSSPTSTATVRDQPSFRSRNLRRVFLERIFRR